MTGIIDEKDMKKKISKFNSSKAYISLKEAEKYCSYSQQYLNLRIRQGKLKAIKFGRNWVTTKNWLDDFLNKKICEEKKEEYISLSNATKFCSYSQEYLNLRIRQGKLKAIKLGRNWATTKTWLDQYLKNVESKKSVAGKNNFSGEEDKIILATDSAFKKEETAVLEEKDFSEVKKLGFKTQDINFTVFQKERNRRRLNERILKPLAAFAVISLLLFSSFAFYKAFENKKPSESFASLTSACQWIKENIFLWLNPIENFSDKDKIQPAEKESISDPLPEKQGLVVVPSIGNDDKDKQKIKNSFSDEVKVEQIDESSGYVIPIFKEKEGEKFMYIMVPLNETENN